MPPLRVLHVVWSASMGGIERLVLHLCEIQAADKAMCPGLLVGKAEGPILAMYRKLGIPVYEAGMKTGSTFSIQKVKKISAIMADYDIIHFHGFNPTLALAGIRSKRMLIYTEHGNFGFGRKLRIRDHFTRLLQGYFLRRYVKTITFNSHFSLNTANSLYHLKNVRKEVVYNGIPLVSTQHGEMSYRMPEDRILVAGIGRMAGVKRFDRLIDAFAKAKLESARLILLGEGPEKEMLEMKVRSLQLQTKIIFPGAGQATDLLAECDLCVVPSCKEAFGLVAIEAYREGKAVLAFMDGGGLTEIVSGHEPQHLFRDTNEMSDFLSRLPGHLHELNSESKILERKQYAGTFSIERMHQALKKIYAST